MLTERREEMLTVKQWRLAKEKSQQEMADALGVHINTYRNMEENPRKIRIGQAVQIAKLLGVSMNDILFTGEATKC